MILAELERIIDAPVEVVFETVANGDNYGKAIPDIARIEFVSSVKMGLNARFRETRHLAGWKAFMARLTSMETTESACTEFEKNQLVRFVTDDVGAYWHSIFTTTPMDGERRTLLTLVVEAHPHNLAGRLVPPLLKRTVAHHMSGDLDAVKAYSERTVRAQS